MFIATIESSVQPVESALAIIDKKDGILYLQKDKFCDLLHGKSFRGLYIHSNDLYVVTANSLLVYRIRSSLPFLKLRKHISLPEWLLGGTSQADIHTLLVSEEKQRVFIGNNNFASIDELSMNGELIQRHHLWEIAPECFPIPTILPDDFQYGHIRKISETSQGSLLITIAFCNQTQEGVVLDFETGEQVYRGLHHPGDGIIHGQNYFVLDEKKGLVNCYTYSGVNSNNSNTLLWQTEIKLPEGYSGKNVNVKGVCVSDDILYCGVCNYNSTSEEQTRPFVVGLSRVNGKQLEHINLPDFVKLRKPRIVSIDVISDMTFNFSEEGIIFYADGEQLLPDIFDEKKPPVTVNDASTKKESTPNVLTINNDRKKSNARKPTIVMNDVSLCYHRGAYFFWSRSRQLRKKRAFWAIKNLSITFYENETVGLVGRNGSGKSTTSRLISGALKPDAGDIVTTGRVQLLALGIGFRPQLTGRENIFVSGAILGLKKKEIMSHLDDIIDFTELGDYIDEPISTYSSGMRSRLGFAVSTAVKPNILILDEVMSTGDAAFRKKANKRMEEMRERTKTVIVVSHSPSQIRELCDRVVWLEKGSLVMEGSTEDILPNYEAFCEKPQKWLEDYQKMQKGV